MIEFAFGNSTRFRAVRTLLLGLAFTWLSLATPLHAQGLSGLDKGDAPLEINAEDGIEWRRDEQTYVARGNARAARGELEVFADVMIASYKETAKSNTDIYRIDVHGDVRIVTPNEVVYGEDGVYDVENGILVLTGDNLKLTSGPDVLTARDSLEYWEGKQLAVARGNAVAIREDKRIRGDVLTAHFEQDAKEKLELHRVDAFGNVEVATQQEFARADKGQYFVKREVARLVGNVKVTRCGNQMNGNEAEVNLATGVSRMLAGDGGPVNVLVVPGSVDKGKDGC
ncbi:LptA/OstA family protein [Pelagibius sp. Alg239-R121]|uniref:LptA/OstA family protein n=1 Tax=Pelagibius sp. Alg239-R121 TaxID=2993448 RepID=UPI0024A63357|nr:LptA/OstA family protein [Pelagibius sp. Alg239-R121]